MVQGALDGTFIDLRVLEHEKGRYRTWKCQVVVNVLGVCNPNMQFIFVLNGWEGSTTDNRVLRDAIHRPNVYEFLLYNWRMTVVVNRKVWVTIRTDLDREGLGLL
ncbi:UNVERIFIED_CONTAM: hypothetical protein Sradi_4134800 [Sesamum radiatum]|uniref:DDE Tnp4 domain-containing protein n=1 Tax=Sesamum radiatum TaxID=300843 RepID=A0AAW2P521_SESRA